MTSAAFFRRLSALASYGYQAVAALLLVLAIGHTLSKGEYAKFSLSLATAQFAAIGVFEWVRLASTRFYPGTDSGKSHIQLASLMAAFLGSASVGTFIVLISLLAGAKPLIVITAGLIAVLQAATDLQLTIVRFRGDLTSFSRSQTTRSTILLATGISGALLSKSAFGALCGVVIGYAISVILLLFLDKPMRSTPLHHMQRHLLRVHFAYGAPAATASALHLGSALIARYAVTCIAPGGTGASTLMAFDLMQRPFSVVAAALHGILYPPVVSAFDHGGFPGAETPLKHLYLIEVGAIGTVAASVILAMLIPGVLPLVIPRDFLPTFLGPAIVATMAFAVRAILVNIAPIAAHLARRTNTIFAVSAVDILLSATTMLPVVFFHLSNTIALLGFLASSTVALLAGLAMSASIKFKFNDTIEWKRTAKE